MPIFSVTVHVSIAAGWPESDQHEFHLGNCLYILAISHISTNNGNGNYQTDYGYVMYGELD